MAKIICLFNHKGGVSKTTTAFNLGWMMAAKGRRVLLADFDPQCNLTGMVLGFQGLEDLDAFYKNSPPNNVKSGLAPAFESQPRQISAAECLPVNGNENLFLLPGHIGLAEYETSLGIAQQLSGSLLALKNLPGSIRWLLDITAESLGIDYVLVDMSPSLGPINQNLLSTSDYFIVPLHPDYFSSMALSSLSSVLPKWREWASTAHGLDTLLHADYPFPKPCISFIGSIVQKYRPKNGAASRAFQTWIEQLKAGMRERLIPSLEAAHMLDSAKFKEKAGRDAWLPIMEVSDFNSQIAMSQEHQVPVYALTKEQANQSGAVWEQTQKNMEVFEAAFSECAEIVFRLTE